MGFFFVFGRFALLAHAKVCKCHAEGWYIAIQARMMLSFDFLAFLFSLDKRDTYTQAYESIRINIVLQEILFLKHTF